MRVRRTYFLTGTTGFVGARLLSQILLQDRASRVIALVRSRSSSEARRRGISSLRPILAKEHLSLGAFERRVDWLPGDLTRGGLGLSPRHLRRILAETTEIFHVAASTRFDLPYAESLEVNLHGTRRLCRLALEMVRAGRFRRFHYVSTAYVAGSRRGQIDPEWLPETTSAKAFSNNYEVSKALAEVYLRRHCSELPLTIYRPSIVVGSSRSGRTTNFNVLYLPMKLLRRGFLPFLPASPRTKLDIVPVDYVTEALLHIARREDSVGRSYHLTAGEDAIPLRDLLERVHQIFDRERSLRHQPPLPRTRCLPSWAWLLLKSLLRAGGRTRLTKGLKRMELYRPYLESQKHFDDATTQTALSGSGIRRPAVRSYLDRIVSYVVKTDFGRHETRNLPELFTRTGTLRRPGQTASTLTVPAVASRPVR